jgi:hypothetical protein
MLNFNTAFLIKCAFYPKKIILGKIEQSFKFYVLKFFFLKHKYLKNEYLIEDRLS